MKLYEIVEDDYYNYNEDGMSTSEKLDAKLNAASQTLKAERNKENYDEYQRCLKARDDFFKKHQELHQSAPNISSEETYKGEHEAPDHTNGAPLYNLKGIYPDDFYGVNGLQHYASDDPSSYYIVRSYHNKPNAILKVYRAIPNTIKAKIEPGNWVTLNIKYAKEHGQDNLLNKYKIITKTVFARDLFTDGNSIQEWGYDPQPRVQSKRELERLSKNENF